ncbi:WEB family protein At4g27595, chloroplastic-like isoform X9 [Penaeus japonicus]|uniref:WEB family protein At4g27595, chloroplastic-like isoform X9 n=1 Tax=Penaeus japonicus TaxID=27405 RepID=UPI001C70BAA1|nr:WEB family protein At4g27595, chloroplastic-like isoform X9 [Penaeus japonicus]
MLRRGTGRTPPFILVGLVLVVLILAFNYWTLSSQNADLQQEIEKIQAEVKISAVKQEQSEKKNAALGETVHEMEELSGKLKQKLKEEDDALSKADKANREKNYEITSLKNQVAKFEEQILSLTQQVEEREVELSKAKEANTHLASERDDAVEAIAEKDTLINTLKRQLEQVTVKRSHLTLSLATCNSELVGLKKECEESQRAADDLADIIVQTKRDVQLEFESKLSQAKEQLAEEKSRSSTLQYSVDDLQKKLTQTYGDLTECEDKVAEIETSLKAQVAKEVKEKSRSAILENSVSDLNSKLTQTLAELTECEESVVKLKTVAEAHEAELSKAQNEVAAVRREKMAVAKPEMVPGGMNLPGIQHKDPYLGPGQLGYVQRGVVQTRDKGLDGITFHRGLPILPRDSPNTPRKQPRFSVADIAKEMKMAENEQDTGVLANPQAIAPQHIVENHGNAHGAGPAVMERPAPPVANNNMPIQPPEGVEGDGNHNNLLGNNNGLKANDSNAEDAANLLKLRQEKEDEEEKGNKAEEDLNDDNKQDNLDAAIDEEEKIVEDLMDDQDEEGNEVKRNNEEVLDEDNALEDLKDHPRVGNLVGGLKVPLGFRQDEANPQDMNVEEDLIGNQGNYYDGNIDNNNIRNLQRPPDFH